MKTIRNVCTLPKISDGKAIQHSLSIRKIIRKGFMLVLMTISPDGERGISRL